MSLEPLEIALLIAGGVAGGFINTLAGGGSAVTIPILTEIVGISVANGTNRIAILAANITAVAGFHKGDAVPWRQVAPLLPAAMAGAGFGAWVATGVDEGVLRRVFALVLLLVAASVLTKPSRWIMLLAGLVFGVVLDLVRRNAAKVLLIASYTPIAILFFASASQIDLGVGVIMAIGQMSGAWIAARLAVKRGAGWVRWILVVAAVVASIRLAFF